jgi:hypothetical protein
MDTETDTFLVAVYTIVDDLYRERCLPFRVERRGCRPVVSDSEVLTLGLLCRWWRDGSERAFCAYARRTLRAYFPRQLSQSAFNRRLRSLGGVLAALGGMVAERVGAVTGRPPTHEVIDGVAVPLMRRCRGERKPFGMDADIGRGGADKDWFFGIRMLVAVQPTGAISGFVAGPASTAEQWLAECLFRWRRAISLPAPTLEELAPLLGMTRAWVAARRGPVGALGPRHGVGMARRGPVVADLGYRGQAWHAHWRADYGVDLLTKDAYDQLPATERAAPTGWLAGLRQQVETVIGQLIDRHALHHLAARTRWGVWTRLGATITAYNIGVLLNAMAGRPPHAQASPLA